jgi:hypothetical protein
MASTTALATSLIQTGLLVAGLVVARVVLMRHLTPEAIPPVLRDRVAHVTRACPWLLGGGLTMTAAGLLLLLV